MTPVVLSLSLAVLPGIFVAGLMPIVATVTLIIERSKRGRGLAGFMLLIGAAAVTGAVSANLSLSGPPPLFWQRLAFTFGTLSFLPLIDVLGDLAERAGAEQPLGIPFRIGKWGLRFEVIVVAAISFFTPLLIRGLRPNPGTGWEPVWGSAWWFVVGSGLLAVVWGLACWRGEHRRCGVVDGPLTMWMISIVLMGGVPLVVGIALPALGVIPTVAWIGVSTVIGAITSLAAIVLSRDAELRRLTQAATDAARSGASGSVPRTTAPTEPGGSRVICCAKCGAAFQSMPPNGVCPMDAGSVGAQPDPLLGSILDDRYRVLRFLGAGGMARVYAAEHSRLRTRVAVKVPWAELVGQPGMVERFMREARAASQLDSPYVVRIHDVGQLGGKIPYIAMELIEGMSLADRLRREGPLVPESVALLGAQLAEGIAAAHAQGIVHRDLKPDNVMIVRRADRDVAKIVDFGLAKLVGAAEAQITQTGAVFGTPFYMSPEQVRGEPAGPAADLYALGVTLYEAARGEPPFHGGTPIQVMFKNLQEPPPPCEIEGHPDLGAAILALLGKDAAARTAAGQGLAARFAAIAGKTVRIECKKDGERPTRPASLPIPDTIVQDAPPGAP